MHVERGPNLADPRQRGGILQAFPPSDKPIAGFLIKIIRMKPIYLETAENSGVRQSLPTVTLT